MEELIKQAFLHVDIIGPHVQEGHYDLIGPNGEIILPSVWEKVVEPDWAITMHMWPMDKAPLRHHPVPPMPPGGIPRPGQHHGRPPHAGMAAQFMRPASARPGGNVPPPPPGGVWPNGAVPGLGPRGRPSAEAANVVMVEPGKPKKDKKPVPTSMLGWMVGGKVKANGNRKYVAPIPSGRARDSNYAHTRLSMPSPAPRPSAAPASAVAPPPSNKRKPENKPRPVTQKSHTSHFFYPAHLWLAKSVAFLSSVVVFGVSSIRGVCLIG